MSKGSRPIDDTGSCSEKQRAANRRNAQRSTGPQTEEGKARSAANSTVHGAFIVTLRPIEHGRFKEDEEEVMTFVDQIMQDLGPRDALEQRQAQRVAQAYLRLQRLDTFEAAALAHDTILESSVAKSLGNPALEEAFDQAAETVEVLLIDTAPLQVVALDGNVWRDVQSWSPGISWAAVAFYLKTFAFEGKIEIEDTWDSETMPATEAEWRAACQLMIRAKFSTMAEAAAWARASVLERRFRNRDVDGRPDGVAATRAIDQSMPKVARLTAFADRSLRNALDIYTQLKTRDLEPDTGEI